MAPSRIGFLPATLLALVIALLPFASLAFLSVDQMPETERADMPCHSEARTVADSDHCDNCGDPGLACECCHVAVSVSLPSTPIPLGSPYLTQIQNSVCAIGISPEPPLSKQYRPPRST